LAWKRFCRRRVLAFAIEGPFPWSQRSTGEGLSKGKKVRRQKPYKGKGPSKAKAMALRWRRPFDAKGASMAKLLRWQKGPSMTKARAP
jgi:hypothetical protein